VLIAVLLFFLFRAPAAACGGPSTVAVVAPHEPIAACPGPMQPGAPAMAY
jgi:hypothetical protein